MPRRRCTAGCAVRVYIANTEGNIAKSLLAICDYVEKWRGRRVPREQVARMDWAVKEQKRLEFIGRVTVAGAK